MKEIRVKAEKKAAAKPVRTTRKRLKTTEWKLAVARAVVDWSQQTKATVDAKHVAVMSTLPSDPAITALPVGGRGWGKVFCLPRIQLPEVVLTQLRKLYKATKISPEAAAAEVHRQHLGNVAVKYHCTPARVKSFFAQLTKAKKKNMNLDEVGLYTELEGRAAESNASLQRELEAKGLKTSGKKSVLIARLERSDDGKATIADYAPGKLPGNSGKNVAGLRVALGAVGLQITGNKKALVVRLDKYEAEVAAKAHEADSVLSSNGGEEPDNGNLNSSVEDRDENDELTELAIDQSFDLTELEDAELEPDDFDGADQEDLLE